MGKNKFKTYKIIVINVINLINNGIFFHAFEHLVFKLELLLSLELILLIFIFILLKIIL